MKRIVLTGLLAGLVMLAINMVVGFIFNLIFPSLLIEYANPYLFIPWSHLRMQLFFLHPFILGIILAYAWSYVKKLFPGKKAWKRGVRFGLAYWIICNLPGMFISYTSFPISLTMLFTWTVSCLIQVIVAGVIYAKMIK